MQMNQFSVTIITVSSKNKTMFIKTFSRNIESNQLLFHSKIVAWKNMKEITIRHSQYKTFVNYATNIMIQHSNTVRSSHQDSYNFPRYGLYFKHIQTHTSIHSLLILLKKKTINGNYFEYLVFRIFS